MTEEEITALTARLNALISEARPVIAKILAAAQAPHDSDNDADDAEEEVRR